MPYLLKYLFYFFIVAHGWAPLPAFAFSWPVFTAPDLNFLKQHEYIATASCPSGQAKFIVRKMMIQPLCKTFCPQTWEWLVQDQQCHDLNLEFNFRNYDILHVSDDQGTTLYSTVIASYGAKNNKNSFRLIFNSPQEHWYCYENNPELHTIRCANDI